MNTRSRRPAAVPLYPYQQRWLRDRARLKIGMWSRQIGKTFTATLEIVDSIAAARAAGRAAPWLILSRGERQAREAMRAGIRLHARAYGLALEAFDHNLQLGGETFRAQEWDAGGGNIVTALPANPDTARGYSRNVYLDEFALHRDSREIWGALYPTITRGWRLRVTSTPRGRSGKFHELMTAANAAGRWSRHIVTIHDAVAQGYPADPEALRAGLADPDLWRQEYECEWLDEASAWLPYELIDACEHRAAGKPELYSGSPVFIGVDIARRRDLWAAWALELVGDIAWTREIRTLRGATFAAQSRALAEMAARYRPVRIAADRTGIGEMPVEDMKRRYGARRVEGVTFTPARKLDLATCLRARMEDKTLRIPANPTLRADLHSVQKSIGPTGHLRLEADNETAADGHADRFWAGALACAAAASPQPAAAGVTITGPRRRSLPFTLTRNAAP